MTATLRELKIIENDAHQDLYFRIRFGACDDFQEALTTFKANVPFRERTYSGNEWTVRATPWNERALSMLFDNWVELYEAQKFHLRLQR